MAPPAYDFWLFDLDGTLVDIEPGYIHDLFERIGARVGYPFTPQEAEQIWHGFGGAPDDQLAAWGVDVEEFWTAFHQEEDAEARAAATFLYDDAARVGEIDAPVGLVTHCQSYLTDPVLDAVDIADWFDSVVCCTAEIGWKPDPGPVELAMDTAGVDPTGNGVLVGDGPHDVGAAWNAGLAGVHVERHDPARRGLCVVGDHRVRGLDELLQ